jgi:hypothetical protein
MSTKDIPKTPLVSLKYPILGFIAGKPLSPGNVPWTGTWAWFGEGENDQFFFL